MHAVEFDGVRFFFNGDFSGNVTILRSGDDPHQTSFEVPFTALAGLVGEAVRRKRISDLEEMGVAKILGLAIREPE